MGMHGECMGYQYQHHFQPLYTVPVFLGRAEDRQGVDPYAIALIFTGDWLQIKSSSCEATGKHDPQRVHWCAGGRQVVWTY